MQGQKRLANDVHYIHYCSYHHSRKSRNAGLITRKVAFDSLWLGSLRHLIDCQVFLWKYIATTMCLYNSLCLVPSWCVPLPVRVLFVQTLTAHVKLITPFFPVFLCVCVLREEVVSCIVVASQPRTYMVARHTSCEWKGCPHVPKIFSPPQLWLAGAISDLFVATKGNKTPGFFMPKHQCDYKVLCTRELFTQSVPHGNL